MKKQLEGILGKKITGVILKEGTGSVRSQVFLLFSDDTYCEFYNGLSVIETTGVKHGDATDIRNYMSGTCQVVDEAFLDTTS